MQSLLDHEAALRLAASLGVLLLMAAWERLAPRRPPGAGRRWARHLALAALGALAVRLLLPLGTVALAALVQARGGGLLPRLALPAPLAFGLTLLAFDLALYAQHVASHRWAWFWRLHRLHHSDTAFDASTALRFHPLEIVVSMLWKLALIAALGPAPLAVLAYEVLLNALALFNHGNVRLPAALDRALRRVVVTPDMHRVHHSPYRDETDSNYGNALALWDRLFGTYRAQPRDGHPGMRIGLDAFRDAAAQRLPALLAQPFVAAPRGAR